MLRMTCDLCGKEISDDGEPVLRHFKIKERKCIPFYGISWEFIDVHEQCVQKLFNVATNQPTPPNAINSGEDE